MYTTCAITDAIIQVLLIDIAPDFLAELDADRRAASDPGLRAATDRIKTWLKDLRRARDAALEPPRLAAAVRSAFVCAVGRGRICVPEDAEFSSWIELSPIDSAFVETVRELAATLDNTRRTSVATDYDAYRDAALERAFELAETAAARTRRDGRRGGR